MQSALKPILFLPWLVRPFSINEGSTAPAAKMTTQLLFTSDTDIVSLDPQKHKLDALGWGVGISWLRWLWA